MFGFAFGKMGLTNEWTYGNEAKSFFAQLATQPTDARKMQYDKLIKTLVASGVWTALDFLYVFAAADQATALTNLVSSSFAATAQNSPTFTANTGIAGNGSNSYLKTGYVPSTANGKLTLNNAHISLWNLTNRAASTADGMGCAGTGSTNLIITPFNAASKLQAQLNEQGGGSTTASSQGFLLGSRVSSATTRTTYYNGISAGSVAANTISLPTVEMFICGINSAGSFSNGTTDTIASASIGSSLSAAQVFSFYNALQTYLHAVGAV